jgi:hypothetical protein
MSRRLLLASDGHVRGTVVCRLRRPMRWSQQDNRPQGCFALECGEDPLPTAGSGGRGPGDIKSDAARSRAAIGCDGADKPDERVDLVSPCGGGLNRCATWLVS